MDRREGNQNADQMSPTGLALVALAGGFLGGIAALLTQDDEEDLVEGGDDRAMRVITGALDGATIGVRVAAVSNQFRDQSEIHSEGGPCEESQYLHCNESINTPIAPKATLHDKLGHYLNKEVKIQQESRKEAKKVVTAIQNELQRVLSQNLPFKIEAFEYTGSSYEGVKVVKSDEFDIMIPIKIPPSWFHVDDSMEIPGFSLIRKTNIHNCGDRFDKYLDKMVSQDVKDYLSPVLLKRHFQSLIQQLFINGNFKNQMNYHMTLAPKGPAITINVKRSTYENAIFIDIVPVLKIGQQLFVPKAHSQHKDGGLYSFLWRESFSLQEKKLLKTMDGQNECRRDLLRVMKTIQLGSSQIRMLSSYYLKTLLFHLNKKTSVNDWSCACLHERFKDFIDDLIECTSSKHLPNYFCPSANLLAEHAKQPLKELSSYLQRIRRRNEYEKLID